MERYNLCDKSALIAAFILKQLNPNEISFICDETSKIKVPMKIITDKNPKELIYPNGWAFSKKSANFSGIEMYRSNGTSWHGKLELCS